MTWRPGRSTIQGWAGVLDPIYEIAAEISRQPDMQSAWRKSDWQIVASTCSLCLWPEHCPPRYKQLYRQSAPIRSPRDRMPDYACSLRRRGLVRPLPIRSMLTWRSPWALAAIPHGGPTSAVRFPPLSRRSIATAPASPRWRISWIASAAADLRPSSPHSPDAAPLHRRP